MLVIQCFTFNPIQENTYLLYNEFGHCVIIDPGCYFDDEREKLQSFITEKNLLPIALLNTHCHLDHVFGNKFIAATYGLTLQLHEKEKQVLAYAPTAGLMYNMPFDNYTGDFLLLKEADKIVMDEDELIVIETPGHSPGSICFYCARQNFIIGGDVLFRGGIGRTNLPLGNTQQLITSIKTKLFILPSETQVYSGHGLETTIGFEKKKNQFLQ